MNERNKVIVFLNALDPLSLNRKIEEPRDRVPAPDLDQFILELGQRSKWIGKILWHPSH